MNKAEPRINKGTNNRKAMRLDSDSIALLFILLLLLLLSEALGNLYIPCPFLYITNIPCPFCGLTRSTQAFLSGEIHNAFFLNPLFVFALLFMFWLVLKVALPIFHIQIPNSFKAAQKVFLRTFLFLSILLFLWRVGSFFFPSMNPDRCFMPPHPSQQLQK